MPQTSYEVGSNTQAVTTRETTVMIDPQLPATPTVAQQQQVQASVQANPTGSVMTNGVLAAEQTVNVEKVVVGNTDTGVNMQQVRQQLK